MAGPLPHSAQIQEQSEHFLKEVQEKISLAHSKLRNSNHFRQIYKASLAAHAVISHISKQTRRPPGHAIQAIVLRVPLLVSIRQLGAAKIDLRRFVELISWSVYFHDHPVEWNRFRESPTGGFVRELDDPIEYCAHRELTFYLNYAKSRLKDEPSGIPKAAVDRLRLLQATLNASVHPGTDAHATTHRIPLDEISEDNLKEFYDTQKSVFMDACILVSAIHKTRFNSLSATSRALFDWLVGSQLSKQIRSGPFGLA
jgi:hypothetical protein